MVYAKPHLRFSTAEYYTHVTTDTQFKAAQTMGNILPVLSNAFRYPLPLGVSVWGRNRGLHFARLAPKIFLA